MTITISKLTLKVLGCAALSTLLLGSRFAKANDLEPGFYLGADAGRSNYKQSGINSGDPTFGLKVGYQFNANFAAEVLVRSLNFRFDGPFADSAYYPESNRSLALLGSLPIAHNVSAYLRLGLGETTMHAASATKHDYQKSEAMMSVGAAYHLTKSWQLNLEASRFDRSKVSSFTIGAQFHF
jgi:hypothetical protein